MKKIYTLTLLCLSVLTATAQITSVANGNFYYPTTWSCMCVPTSGTDDLTINHTVTLNNDLQLLAGGSITINSSGSLLQDIPSRDFLLNGGTFINNGDFSIDRMLGQSGSFGNTGTAAIRTFANYLDFGNSGTINNVDSLYNDGYIDNNGIIDVGTFYNDSVLDNYGSFPAVDSLTNAGTMTNYAGAVIDADSMTNTGAFTNNGWLYTGALYNTGNYTNNNYHSFYWLTNGGVLNNVDSMVGGASMWNIEDFTNHASGVITLGGNFYNGDTLNFDASFVNDGVVEIAMSWFNTDDVSGNTPGYFIIQDSTANIGTMSGSFDFCDLTPTATVAPFVDFNSGTADANITWCIMVSQDEPVAESFSIYPNPASNIIALTSLISSNLLATVYDYSGRELFSATLNSSKNEMDVSSLTTGIYFMRVASEGRLYSKPFVVVR
jgi:hypothetical protein